MQRLLSITTILFLAVTCETATYAQSTYSVCNTDVTGSSMSQASPLSSAVSCNPTIVSNPNYSSTTLSASARATYGILGASGTGSDTGLYGESGFGYLAQADFQDTFTFVTSTPTTGEVTLSDLISGSEGYYGSGSYSAGEYGGEGNYTFVSGSLATAIDGTYVSFTLANGSTTASQSYPFTTADFASIGNGLYQYTGTFNEDLTVTGSCIVYVGNCSLFTDYYDTAQVTGLTFMSNLGGELSGVLSTGSGTNYNAIPGDTAATPEPSTLVLLGTGLLGVTKLVRRKFLPQT